MSNIDLAHKTILVTGDGDIIGTTTKNPLFTRISGLA